MMQLAKPPLVSAFCANTVTQLRRPINISILGFGCTMEVPLFHRNNTSMGFRLSTNTVTQLRRPMNISIPGLRCIMEVPLFKRNTPSIGFPLFANAAIQLRRPIHIQS